jgi:hypothetical protein
LKPATTLTKQSSTTLKDFAGGINKFRKNLLRRSKGERLERIVLALRQKQMDKLREEKVL